MLWFWTCVDFLQRSFKYRKCFAQTQDISGRLAWRRKFRQRHNVLSACYYLGWCAILLEKFANHRAPCSGCSGDVGSAFMGSLGPPSKAGIINSRSAVLTYACALLQGLLLYWAIYYVPSYFEAVKGYSPTTTGLALFALSITVFLPTL